MIWWMLVYWIAAVLVSVALAPKPPKPKPASLTDFDFPTAEEDRPIPVLFGKGFITGPNVVWYGDLRVKKRKKGGLMGSSTVGYKYYISFHIVLGYGPWDEISAIRADDKEAWSGSVTESDTISIDKLDLFGGKNKGGGLLGVVDVLMGEDTQTPNAYLETQLGAGLVPAYRGVTGLLWRRGIGDQGYVGSSEYIKNWSVEGTRILAGWTTPVFYPETAVINGQMNGAHIIYQCLTDVRWGMGEAPGSIDEDSFEDVADALLAEEFGLFLPWNQQESIENFIAVVLDHIDGSLFFNHGTNKYQLALTRANYDPDTLPTFDESEITNLTSYQRQLWGETVNELTLSYTDPDTGKPTPVTVQDQANILTQQRVVPIKVEYPGIVDKDIALMVAMRELAGRSTPLSKVVFEVNRRAWMLRQSSVFKLSWAREGIASVVYRAAKIRGGVTLNGKITVEAMEDIFSQNIAVYTEQQDSSETLPVPIIPDDDNPRGPNVVSSSQTAPPTSPSNGDMYLVGPGATGDWAGHDGELAEWDSENEEWLFTPVPDGMLIWDANKGAYVTVTGGVVTPPNFGSVDVQARDVRYDDSSTGMGVDNVQDAIQQLVSAQESTTITVKAFARGLWYAQTTNGDFYDSEDGLEWTPRATLGQTSVLNLLWDGEKYYATRNNQLGYSDNEDIYGEWHWQSVGDKNWVGIKFLNGKFYAWVETTIVEYDPSEDEWVAPAGSGTTYGDLVEEDEPIGWWKLGDDTDIGRDSISGNNARFNPGVGLLGATTNTGPGLVGSGLSCRQATRTYIEPRTPDNNPINFFDGTDPFTIEFWVRRHLITPSSTIVLFSQNAQVPSLSSEYHQVAISWEQGSKTIHFTLGTSSDFVENELEVEDVVDLFDGASHHIVATRNSTTLTLYIDGEEVGVEIGTITDLTRSVGSAALGTIWGNVYADSAFRFSSQLDELALYDTWLPATRALAHYVKGKSGIGELIVKEIIYDEPEARFLVFGEYPEAMNDGTTQYRPRVHQSFDNLSTFEFNADLAPDPATDDARVVQVASRLAMNNVPEESRWQFYTRSLFRSSPVSSNWNPVRWYQNPVSGTWLLFTADPNPQIRQYTVFPPREAGDEMEFGPLPGSGLLTRGGLAAEGFIDSVLVDPTDPMIVYVLTTAYESPTGTFHWCITKVQLATDGGIDLTEKYDATGGTGVRFRKMEWVNGMLGVLRSGSSDLVGSFSLIDTATMTEDSSVDSPLGTHFLGLQFIWTADDDFIYVAGKKYDRTDFSEVLTFEDPPIDEYRPELGDTAETAHAFRVGISVRGDWLYTLTYGGGATLPDQTDGSGRISNLYRYNINTGVRDTGFGGRLAQLNKTSMLGMGGMFTHDDRYMGVATKDYVYDMLDPDDPVLIRSSIIAVAMNRPNSARLLAVLDETVDEDWQFPSVSWPVAVPPYGFAGIVWDGLRFIATGRGWSGVSDDAQDWTFSDGTSNLPETSFIIPYPDGLGRTAGGIRGSHGNEGTVATDDGLHWELAAEITIIAADVGFDPSDTDFESTDLQALMEEISDMIGVAEGLATLDGSGKIPLSQLPTTILGSVEYIGTWNANTNSPDLGASSPSKGDYYVVSTAGATSLGGITEWDVNDWAIYNGAAWEKVDNTSAQLDTDGRLKLAQVTLLAPIADSGSSRTYTAADYLAKIRFTSASAVSYSLIANGTLAVPVGMVTGGRQCGAGQVTISAPGGVTLNVPTGFIAKTRAQGSDFNLHKVATDEWDLSGDLSV